jgi:DNA-binding PadR family transcriptional regulator
VPGEELETVDLEAVPILAANVRIFGVGSPPEGDVYSPDDLRKMAEAAQELEAAGEFDPPARIGKDEPLGRNKLGHRKEQVLLASDPVLGELPAAGWLRNQRVSEDGTQLLADVRGMPKKVSQLVRAHAYRKRSAEISRIRSQKTDKVYDRVVSGLAWLGGKMPAVRTLDDVVALYEGDDAEPVFRTFEDPPDLDGEVLRDALVDWGARDAKAYAEKSERPADSGPVAEVTLTEEQHKTLAEKLGVKLEELTPEKLLEGVDELKQAAEKPDDDGDDSDSGDEDKPDEAAKQLEARIEAAEKRAARVEEQLETERKFHAVTEVIKSGKEPPGRKAEVETLYDKLGPELFQKNYESIVADPVWSREYGSDEDGDPESEQAKELLAAHEADMSSRLGIKKEELV